MFPHTHISPADLAGLSTPPSSTSSSPSSSSLLDEVKGDFDSWKEENGLLSMNRLIEALASSESCSILALPPTRLFTVLDELRSCFEKFNVSLLPAGAAGDDVARYLVHTEAVDASFFVVDVGKIIFLAEQWRKLFPDVTPFYAVKCNPDPVIVHVLAALGCGFDCASQAEISLVTGAGVEPDRIVYANPFKNRTHLRYARIANVRRMTVDSVDELHKIQKEFPEAELVLRITTDDAKSALSFSSKFGAPRHHWRSILEAAKDLKLNLVGVSFHVGSGCGDVSAYDTAIGDAMSVFRLAEELQMPSLYLIDIGGGFPGSDLETALHGRPTLSAIAEAIRAAMEKYVPREDLESGRVRFISEPGRYFATRSHELCSTVFGRRSLTESGDVAENEENCLNQLLYIDDGVYQSFNGILTDHLHPRLYPLYPELPHLQGMPEIQTKVFGQTCDSLDVIFEKTFLPRLRVGDWLRFPDMGAYSTTLNTGFNGFPPPKKFYVCSDPAFWSEDASDLEYALEHAKTDSLPQS